MYGMKSHLMVNFQNSFGTVFTSSLDAVPIISEGLTQAKEQLVEQSMYARFQESPYHEGQNMVQGDVQMEALPTEMGYFLKSVFGQVSTTSGAGTQTHVFETRNVDFDDRSATPPMTFEVFRDVGSAYQYYDCLVNNLNLNIANGQLINMTAGMVASGFTRSAASTPVFGSSKPFIWDQSSVSFNDVEVLDLSDLTVNIQNNLEHQWTLKDGKVPHRAVRTSQQTIEVSGTFRFNSQSYQQSFEAQDETSFIVTLTNIDSPHTLKMDFSKLRFKTFDATIAGPGTIDASFTAQAIYNTSSATCATFTLVNTKDGY